MKTCYRSFLFAWLAFSVGAAPAGEREQEFRANVVKEWASIIEQIRTAQWQLKCESYSALKSGPLSLKRIDIEHRLFDRQAGRMWRSQVDEFQGETAKWRWDKIDITNKFYSAELMRPKKPAEQWVLTSVKLERKSAVERFADELRCPWLLVGNVYLYDWLKEPGFVVSRLEPSEPAAAPAVVRAFFTYNPAKRASNFVKDGYLDFEPARHFRPVGYQFHSTSHPESAKYDTWTGTSRGRLVYSDEEGIPVLKSSHEEDETRSKLKGLILAKQMTTFSDIKYNEHVGDDQFQLRAYGLPEPTGVPTTTSRVWYLWFGLAAVICLLIALLFHWLHRSADTASAAGPRRTGGV